MEQIAQALRSIAVALSNPWQLFYTTFTNTGTAGGTFSYMRLGPIKLLWGTTVGIAVGGTGVTLVLPVGFFTTILSAQATALASGSYSQYANLISITTSLFSVSTQGSAGSPPVIIFVVGV